MNTLTQRILARGAEPGKHTVLHATVLTLVATAIFMMTTSSGLGPLGPLVVAAGFYLLFGALALEIIMGLFAFGRWLARKGLKRSA